MAFPNHKIKAYFLGKHEAINSDLGLEYLFAQSSGLHKANMKYGGRHNIFCIFNCVFRQNMLLVKICLILMSVSLNPKTNQGCHF